jgi:hypothetical protein
MVRFAHGDASPVWNPWRYLALCRNAIQSIISNQAN